MSICLLSLVSSDVSTHVLHMMISSLADMIISDTSRNFDLSYCLFPISVNFENHQYLCCFFGCFR